MPIFLFEKHKIFNGCIPIHFGRLKWIFKPAYSLSNRTDQYTKQKVKLWDLNEEKHMIYNFFPKHEPHEQK